VVFLNPSIILFNLLVRLFALYGYLALAIAAVMTPFLKEITQSLGKSFLTIHHVFALLGITLVTLHPITYAIQTLSLTVFLPRFDSWRFFWILAGIPALYIIYVASLAAITTFRRRGRRYWRAIHTLNYVALLFGIIHASLIGTSSALRVIEPPIVADFNNIVITLIFDGMFLAIILTFILKRYRWYQQQSKRKSVLRKA